MKVEGEGEEKPSPGLVSGFMVQDEFIKGKSPVWFWNAESERLSF